MSDRSVLRSFLAGTEYEEFAKRKRSRAWLTANPNPKSSPKEIVGSHGHRPHGPSILWPALYEHLRSKGMTKRKAAMISNGMWRKKRGLPPKSVPGTEGLVGVNKARDGDGDGFTTNPATGVDNVPVAGLAASVRAARKKRLKTSERRARLLRSSDDLSEERQMLERLRSQGGFTLDPLSLRSSRMGFAVAIAPKQSLHLPAGEVTARKIAKWQERNAKELGTPGVKIGGWLDTETGDVWLDIVRVLRSQDQAEALGREANQIAIFDLNKMEEIRIGGTGEALSKMASRIMLRMFNADTDPQEIADWAASHKVNKSGGFFVMSEDNYGRHGYTEFEKAELLIAKRSELREMILKARDGDGDGFVNDGRSGMRPAPPKLPKPPKMSSPGADRPKEAAKSYSNKPGKGNVVPIPLAREGDAKRNIRLLSDKKPPKNGSVRKEDAAVSGTGPTASSVHVPAPIPDFPNSRKRKQKPVEKAGPMSMMPRRQRDGDGDGMVASRPGGPEDTRVQPMARKQAPASSGIAPSDVRREQMKQRAVPKTMPEYNEDLVSNRKPRYGAKRVEEDEVPERSPSGAKLMSYKGGGAGIAFYADNSVYDGRGWQPKPGSGEAKAETQRTLARRQRAMSYRTGLGEARKK